MELAAAPAGGSQRLEAAIRHRGARIAVVGLGYVGLPMALRFVQAGFRVIGLESDPARSRRLASGLSYVSDVPEAALREALESGAFVPTTESRLLGEADAILICVPTPLRDSRDPDLSAIHAASAAVREQLRRDQLVILESTTYPGTTEEVLLPCLEQTGLRAGQDFFLAFSPERVDPGNPAYGVHNIPKLVGGCTPACTGLAAELYRQVVTQVVTVSSPRVAEAAKLLENTFRSVNIGLVNELAIVCRHLGIDVWEVIQAAATKPFGFMPHYPGPGIGGHCIPLDPHYLSWKARLHGYEPRFIGLASEINGSMPHHVVELVNHGLNEQGRCVNGSRVLLLGVAYKPEVADVRESPALEIVRLLARRGARVAFSDPFVDRIETDAGPLSGVPLQPETLRGMDCAVIVTHHRAVDYEMVVRESRLVIDTRNAARPYRDLGCVRFL